MRALFLLLLLALLFPAFSREKEDEHADEKAALRKDIAKYEEDIASLNKKIAKNRREIETEAKQHKTYLSSFQKELTRDNKELKELEQEFKTLQKGADKLSRTIAGKQYKIREYTKKQKAFTKSLLNAIAIYKKALAAVPTPIVAKESGSLDFLEQEIKSGAVGNGEGTERLWQLTKGVASNRSSVDVWTGRSTFKGIEGQVHYIRIGYGWLACVNDDATKAALWQLNGSEGKWNEITDPAQINAVRSAVKIRNGNRLPEIISLPIQYSAVEEKSNEK